MTTHHASPDAIEGEISETRRDIGRTLDALESRLSPGQMVDQVFGYLKENGGGFADNLGRSVRDNPLPVTLIGVGLAWMAAASAMGGRQPSPDTGTGHASWPTPASPAPRPHAPAATPRPAGAPGGKAGGGWRSTGPSAVSPAMRPNGGRDPGDTTAGAAAGVGDSLSGAARGLREGVAHAADAVQDGAAHLREQVAEGAHAAGHRATELGRGAWRQGVEGYETVSRVVRDNPLLLGVAGAAIGCLIGALAPRTRHENAAFGAESDRLKRAAIDEVAEGFGRVRDAAVAAGMAAERTAEEEGLTAERGVEAAETVIGSGVKVAKEAIRAAEDEVARAHVEESARTEPPAVATTPAVDRKAGEPGATRHPV